MSSMFILIIVYCMAVLFISIGMGIELGLKHFFFALGFGLITSLMFFDDEEDKNNE